MNDAELLNRIESMVEEEQSLLGRETADAANDEAIAADRDRLAQLQVSLDRCWDLLRQRRALRDAGEDPDQAQIRDANTVENYRQ